MKTLKALILLLLPCSVLADEFHGEVYALDARAHSITLTSKRGMKTYRVRANSEISVNGMKGRFEDLNTGMTAKVVSAEPSIASTIIAVGVPNRPANGIEDSAKALTEKLRNTRWRLSDADRATFTLHSDGSTNLSRHDRKGTWKVIAGNTIELSIWKKGGFPEKVTVNPEVTSIRWLSGELTANRIKE